MESIRLCPEVVLPKVWRLVFVVEVLFRGCDEEAAKLADQLTVKHDDIVEARNVEEDEDNQRARDHPLQL